MKIRWGRFNLYLALLVPLALSGAGCLSPEKKLTGSLRFHLETNPDGTDRTRAVPIYRQSPMMVTVESSPFMTEALLSGAAVIDTAGGFSVKVTFKRRGKLLLEQYTTSNRGKRIAIFSEFSRDGNPKDITARWLAAPVITQRVSDGIFVFTPDATREEAQRIVRGLNNYVRKIDKRSWIKEE